MAHWGMRTAVQLGYHRVSSRAVGLRWRKDKSVMSPQRTALLAAFGMVEAEVPDRFFVALALLELLSDLAEQEPLLVVAEDAQWLDRSTVGVLAFVARRVEHEPIVVLAACRE